MVRIRLQRFGRTHRPFFRIAAMDSREPRNGKVLENLGWYNPIEDDAAKQLNLKEDRIREWIGRGAQPTDTVRDLLAKHDMLSDEAKAAWNADREHRRASVDSRKASERAHAIVTELRAFAEQAEADVSEFVTVASAARKEASVASRRVNVEVSTAAADRAQKAFDDAKKAEETHQAKAAAAKPAEPAEGEAEEG